MPAWDDFRDLARKFQSEVAGHDIAGLAAKAPPGSPERAAHERSLATNAALQPLAALSPPPPRLTDAQCRVAADAAAEYEREAVKYTPKLLYRWGLFRRRVERYQRAVRDLCPGPDRL